jgi:hypothetical protein
MSLKKQNSHTSARKNAAPRSTSPGATMAASKASKSAKKTRVKKDKDKEDERTRKRIELTLRAFRMAYESNQRGEFHRL